MPRKPARRNSRCTPARAGVSFSQWQTLLRRWCPLETTPEVKLLCAILAQAIDDEPAVAAGRRAPPFTTGFFRTGAGGFFRYCGLLNLDGDFVLEQIARARAWPDQAAA